MLKRTALLVATLVLAGTAASAQSDNTPEHVSVQLTSYRITPATINLKRGQAYILDIENDAGSSHDFSAREFFASSAMAAEDRAKAERGEVELKGHQKSSVLLTPGKAGDFEFHCGHPFHAMLGMRGVIHVS